MYCYFSDQVRFETEFKVMEGKKLGLVKVEYNDLKTSNNYLASISSAIFVTSTYHLIMNSNVDSSFSVPNFAHIVVNHRNVNMLQHFGT